ncbi:hypothetical protein [Deinococcus apachensis]|uniref:hypothetical protein n=1 Tax=Deinococcus apachensis TaxID=309886 RepID=UPI00036BBE8E|nr:hypothetical protein [Deinococcus apachensis]
MNTQRHPRKDEWQRLVDVSDTLIVVGLAGGLYALITDRTILWMAAGLLLTTSLVLLLYVHHSRQRQAGLRGWAALLAVPLVLLLGAVIEREGYQILLLDQEPSWVQASVQGS